MLDYSNHLFVTKSITGTLEVSGHQNPATSRAYRISLHTIYGRPTVAKITTRQSVFFKQVSLRCSRTKQIEVITTYFVMCSYISETQFISTTNLTNHTTPHPPDTREHMTMQAFSPKRSGFLGQAF